MNWQSMSIAQMGRAAGVIIIVVGTIVSAWTAFDQPRGFDGDQSWKFFLQGALQYFFSGMLVIVIAEVAERIGFWSSVVAEDLGADDEPPASAPPNTTP